ncbi:hypothetical protein [Streptomyces altiplanensis]
MRVICDRQPLVLEPDVTPAADTPVVRVVNVAGTRFLQMRGGLSCDFAADSTLGALPAGSVLPKLTRAVCPRDNSRGINACRVDANPQGLVKVYGATSTNRITWIDLGDFSSALA